MKVTRKRPTGRGQKPDKRALDVGDLRAFVMGGRRAQLAVDRELERAAANPPPINEEETGAALAPWGTCPGPPDYGVNAPANPTAGCPFDAQTRGGVLCRRCDP